MKKQKRELLNNTFNSFIEVGLSGENLEILEDIVSKDVVGFGTTVDEKLFGVKELRDLLIRQKEQSAGMALSWKINTLDLYISSDENTAIFTNEITLYLTVDDNPIEIYLRFSIVMEYADDKWMVVHWHGSKPEHVESEKDTWGLQTWKEKAEELENLVAERTADLVVKNRELEIETALERIRAQAVAMKESTDLLDIVVTMRNEFIKLGHEAHYFWHMMWLPETYEKAMTSGDGTKIGFVMQLPRHIHGNIPQLAKWEKSTKPTVVYTMTVDEAIDYVDKMVSLGDFKNIDPQAPSHDDIRHIGGLTFIMARTTHGEIGYSLPGVVENPPKEDIDILVKFASAFDLAHQRFFDLQKAENQARETQIELALEKIRSRSMAMHKSDELKEIILVVYDQLVQLQVKVEHAGFIIDYKEHQDMHIWLADRNAVFPKIVLPYFDCAHWNNFIEAKKTGQNFFTNQLGFEEKNKFYKDVFQFIPNLPDDTKATYFEFEGLAISTVLLDNVGLYIENYQGVPFSDEENAILMRFGKVFQQAYTRFLDLQKAEAQAQEAQIEAALEKVRSRSLAMHKSDELKEVVAEVLKKLQELNIAMESRVAVIVIFEEGSTDFNQWVASPTDISNTYISTPYFEHIILSDFWKAREIGLDFYSKSYSRDEKNTYFEHFFDHSFFKNFEGIEEQKKWALEKEFYNYSPVFETNSSLGIADFSGEPLSEKEISILKRFAKVFEQAYIRFLDLQKAEAQAREAQIQLALERVRAKTMAMKTQSDLLGIVELFGQQLSDLNVRFTDVTFIEGAITKDRDWELWSHIPGADNLTRKIHIPYVDTPYFTKTAIAVEEYEKSGNPIQTKFFSKEEKDEFLDHYWKYAPAVPEKVRELVYANPGSTIVDAFLENVTVSIVRSDLEPFTEEELSIFERFSKEFKQTYTRYLDIKKAEAQARESEIQLALERVRARTMAMQKSEELAEASQVLDQQVRALGIETWGCAFHIYADNDEGDFEWFSGANGLLPFYKTPREEFFLKFYEKGQQGEKFHVEEFKGEDCKTHYDFLKTIPVAGDALKALEESGVPLPTYQIDHIAFFNHGYVLFITYKPFPEAHDIFQRFAKVFEQTYTRFLDLQKAEAQTREAQIEAALEKVRSRSLAMHTPNELGDVVTVIVEKLKELDVVLDANGVVLCTYFTDSKNVLHWIAAPDFSFAGSYLLPYFDHPIFNDAWQSKANGELYFSKAYSIDDKNSFFEYAFEHSDYKHFPEDFKQWVFQNDQHILSFAWQKNSAILIPSHTGVVPSPDEVVILKRFAKVFEQSFIRFLDLQKAESQAREAQIEAALEKVRSRSMAMHNSQELNEVALELRKQMGLLGQKDLEVCAIHLYGNDEDSFESWSAMKSPDSETEIVQTQAHFPKRGIRIVDEMMHHDTIGTKDYVLINEGEKIAEWFKVLKIHAPELHASIMDSIGKVPIKQLKANWAVANFSGGALVMVTYSEPDEVSRNLLRRSANVFEQAYVRFLDLQKAEAQAKEAQIEAALEKVRSRSLAMHRSDELKEVVSVVFEKLKDLQIPFTAVGIATNIEGSKDLNAFVCGQNEAGLVITNYRLPYFDNPVSKDVYGAIEKQLDYFVGHYSKEEKDTFYEHIIEHTDEFRHLPDDIKRMIFESTNYTISMVAVKNAVFNVNDFEGKVLAENEIDIIKRFARVFEQAYIRFLDLQKAESQAREAQIEVAVERVRAKALAMHKSTEILQVAMTLKEQMEGLNLIGITAATIYLEHGDNKIRVWDITELKESEQGPQLSSDFTFRLEDTDPGLWVRRIWNASEKYSVIEMSGDDFIKCEKWIREFDETAADNYREFIRAAKIEHTWHPTVQLEKGKLNLDFTVPPPLEMEFILPKMGAAFDLAYRRFLDLQKAEAQAKEAQVEAALERVRSRSMAMHQSTELRAVVDSLYGELKSLEINFDNALIQLIKDDTKDLHLWVSTADGLYNDMIHWPASNLPHFDLMYAARVAQSDVDISLSPEQINAFFEEYFGLPYVPQERKAAVTHVRFFRIFGTYQKNTCVFLMKYSPGAFSSNEKDIITRFAKVFEQTYTRFLDLQKAEKQAREAKIEASLERVRAHTMGLRKSSELETIINVIFEELQKLGLTLYECSIFLRNGNTREFTVWGKSNSDNDNFLNNYQFYFVDHPLLNEVLHDLELKIPYREFSMEQKELKSYADLIFSQTAFRDISQEYKNSFYSLKKVYAGQALFQHGLLEAVGTEPLSRDLPDVLKRFSHVIDLTYTRFLDLQKAEAQAREATIESALERVRSRSLAMHHSSELSSVVDTLLREFTNLEFTLTFCIINLIDEQHMSNTVWAANPEEGKDPESYYMKFEDYPFHHAMWDAWKAQKKRFVYTLEGEEKKIYDEYLYNDTEFRRFPKHIQEVNKALERYVAGFTFFKYSGLQTVSVNPISEYELEILERFGRVFEQAYTRFLDLQKAEAQTREAQIEVAIERVRAQSMAMHQPDDLDKVNKEILKQLHELKVTGLAGVSIWLIEDDGWVKFWDLSSPGNMGDPDSNVMQYDSKDFDLLGEPWRVLRESDDKYFVFEYSREKLQKAILEWDQVDPKVANDFREALKTNKLNHQWNPFARYSNGIISLDLVNPPTEDTKNILLKLAGAFDLAYQRFLDLQKAESQAREAQIEAALEKVRSRTLAMQKSAELAETSVVVFKELLKLGIESNRLFIGIVKDNAEAIDAWATNEDGSKIEQHFTLYPSKNRSIKKMVEGWKQQKKSAIIDMEGEELTAYFHYLNRVMHIPFIDGLKQKRRVQSIAYFSGGLIGMASPKEQPQGTINLLERFAAVFNLTYTRFKDLKIAEAQARQAEEDLINLQKAKKNAEEALAELQTTQKQLIQQEKLASLGQLTAGIAHEIKNPLNFVNNFSEVSIELIEEALEEINQIKNNPHATESAEILTDVKTNLTKIHEHGSRADSIVKSMLMHSRGGSGKMEPTDLNALIKEYVNLAFHGMRAGKNPISVAIDLQLDEQINKIPLVEEDFSRVLLNLCNNAFDAMRERRNANEQGPNSKEYRPKLTVRTISENGKMSIEIEDNGPGIPDDIKDKILQPFFTTKKGTEGTGLGLSITNDIIKAHGGILNIKSEIGKGSTFIIALEKKR